MEVVSLRSWVIGLVLLVLLPGASAESDEATADGSSTETTSTDYDADGTGDMSTSASSDFIGPPGCKPNC